MAIRIRHGAERTRVLRAPRLQPALHGAQARRLTVTRRQHAHHMRGGQVGAVIIDQRLDTIAHLAIRQRPATPPAGTIRQDRDPRLGGQPPAGQTPAGDRHRRHTRRRCGLCVGLCLSHACAGQALGAGHRVKAHPDQRADGRLVGRIARLLQRHCTGHAGAVQGRCGVCFEGLSSYAGP